MDGRIADLCRQEWQTRIGGSIEPADVARASVFLLSDDAAAITGEVLVVDGGWQFND